MRFFSYLKLIDSIILPVTFVVAFRYLGVFLASFFFQIQFSLSKVGDFSTLPFIQFSDSSSRFLGNSISWILVALVLAFYFGFVVFRSFHLHEDHLHPKHAQEIYSKNLEFLIINARDSLHQTMAWSILAAFSIMFATKDLFTGGLQPLFFGILFSVSLLLIVASGYRLYFNLALERKEV
ncbi:hypothetical protein IH981_04500 [Patescibacteria group bacterium]|nr:hypothetical protein [Patescibacteria group bacterium]